MRSNSFAVLDSGKERRTIYRITIENEIPPSAVNKKKYHRVAAHRRLLFFIALCLFSRNEYVSCPEAITDGKEGLSSGKPAQSKETLQEVKGTFNIWYKVQFL